MKVFKYFVINGFMLLIALMSFNRSVSIFEGYGGAISGIFVSLVLGTIIFINTIEILTETGFLK